MLPYSLQGLATRWLAYLPEWDSHPFDYTTLPGRTSVMSPEFLGVVDDHLPGNTAEELEGPAMAGKPGGCLLIKNNLGVGVPAEAQGHDEHPGLGYDVRENILNIRPLAEVNLGRLSRFKLQNAGDWFFMIAEFLRQTPHGRITAGKTEPPGQRPLNRSQANAVAKPGADLFLMASAL